MSRTIRKTIDHVLYEVWLNVAAPTPMGMAGKIVETVVRFDVDVMIDFSYSPAEPMVISADDPGAPAEVAIRSIKMTHGGSFNGERMSLFVEPGFDLLEVLPEIQVEKLEEMIIKRAENKEDA